MEETKKDNGPEFVVLKFADSKIPVFKETKNRDWVLYGENNKYPEYLTYLFDKSAKHNSIITGKAGYVYGSGFVNGDFIINRTGDTLNDLTKKAILDIELYGGFYWEVMWNALGKICEIYHVDYATIRKSKGDGYYFKESWGDQFDRKPGEYVREFGNPDKSASQIFAYKEYRPMTRFYPLPSYIGCNNYIETDIEISKFHLSSIRNGMMPSKMIQFFKGEPTEEKKAEVEKRLSRKFSGAENAGKFLLVFNDANNVDQTLKVDDLSANELDKQFDILNKTCQQEIFSGHRVTSPMLFGIKEAGQLGGNTELYTSYSIFQNTYSKPKASAISKEVEYILSFSNYKGQYELMPTDPIGIQFDVKDVINALPKKYIFEKLNIPEQDWGLENIGSDNRPTPTIPIAPDTTVGAPDGALSADVNHIVKNMTAKQYQQLTRIIREYKKGKLAVAAAKTLLRAGLGLTDDDINSLLGIHAAMMAEDESGTIAVFDSYGDSKTDYIVVKSKPVAFTDTIQAEFDEEIYIKEAYKTYDVTQSESQIIELIKKDKLITADVIARSINQTIAYVQSKIDNLISRGYINQTETSDGIDTVVERVISPDIDLPPTTIDKTPVNKISIMYSYEGPQDSKNRPFCARLMQLNRIYSRADIETMSQRLGYSVFDRRGGFWTRKGTHDTTPYCRHRWQSNIVIKKG